MSAIGEIETPEDADGEALLVARRILQREAETLAQMASLYQAWSEVRASMEARRAVVLRADEVIASWFPDQTPPPGPRAGSTPAGPIRNDAAGGRDTSRGEAQS